MMVTVALLLWCGLLLRVSSFVRTVGPRRTARSSHAVAAANPATLSLDEVLDYAACSSLKLVAKETGPYLRLEAFTVSTDELVGYLTCFVRPFPFGLLQLETIQVKNHRQNLGYERKGWTVEGPGISFVMGSYALSWARARGCRKAQLLAVNDSPAMHQVLIRMYASYGFTVLREVTEDNVRDRLVWGAVGTLMELDVDAFFQEWRPKFNVMMQLGKRRQAATLAAAATTTATTVEPTSPPPRPAARAKVALTREDGANGKLAALLADKCDILELPCIAFADGDDVDQLPAAMTAHDLVVITSPQAAGVFLKAWDAAGRPAVQVASVGKGTSAPLVKAGITPVFEPSDFTAESLAAEIPATLGTTVLYPSSAIAENTLANGLTERGFKVTRLNTYATVPATWTPEQTEQARSVDIVTFGSPSAVKTWAAKVGTEFTAVVIGPTSAKAATTAGYTRVIAPEGGSKGIEAWADTVVKAATEMKK